MKNKNEELTFKDIISVFVPKIWLILIVAVVFGAIMGVYSSFLKKDTYTASSTMFAYKDTPSISSTDMLVAENMVKVYSIVLTSDDVLNDVIANLPAEYANYNVTASFLRNVMTISEQGNGVFKISVTTDNPQLSFALAEGIENIAPSAIKTNVQSVLSITIFESPKLPTAPNSKHLIRNVAIAFIVGALVAAIVVWLVNVFDIVIRDKKKLEDNFDIPVLGVIPIQILSENSKGDVHNNAV